MTDNFRALPEDLLPQLARCHRRAVRLYALFCTVLPIVISAGLLIYAPLHFSPSQIRVACAIALPLGLFSLWGALPKGERQIIVFFRERTYRAYLKGQDLPIPENLSGMTPAQAAVALYASLVCSSL